jgi:hypothetical protein
MCALPSLVCGSIPALLYFVTSSIVLFYVDIYAQVTTVCYTVLHDLGVRTGISTSQIRGCFRSKDWRCRTRVSPVTLPCRAHAASPFRARSCHSSQTQVLLAPLVRSRLLAFRF